MEMWIARDKNSNLFLFQLEPIRAIDVFIGGGYVQINSYSFSEVTWENSPQKVTIELADNKNQ